MAVSAAGVSGEPVVPHRFDWLGFTVCAALGSALSIASTGYVYGTGNQLYFFPILDALFNQPQFANDGFIQTLHYYAAGPWQLLRGFGQFSDYHGLLFVLNFVSRFTAFAGLLACAELLGLKTRRAWIIITLLLCLTPVLRGGSLAGGGGLFVTYFTHSEWANGLTLLLVACLVRGRYGLACALNGFIFFVNAFIGVWDAVVILGVLATATYSKEIRLGPVLVKCLIGSVIGLGFTLPVVANIVHSPDFGKPIKFDYIHYLSEFWPYHFIFSAISLSERLNFAAMILVGWLAFLAHGRQARLFLAAYLSFLAVYAFGIIAPSLTHAPLVLNLHLLRVGTMLQFLAVLAPLSLATKWALSEDRVLSHLFAPLIVLVLCMPISMGSRQPLVNFTLAAAVVAAYWVRPAALPAWLNRLGRLPAYAVVALILIGFGVVSVKHAEGNAGDEAWIGEWNQIGEWARTGTPREAKFLLPTWNFVGAPPSVSPGSPLDSALQNDVIFEHAAERVSWIDFRLGAAVMWAPSYYPEWHRRVTEVNALRSHADRLAYAKNNGISYVVEGCDAPTAVFKTARLCVYRS